MRKMRADSSNSCPGSPNEAMTVTGYSDVINHALAFAAKHHDRQVRKGTKLPYLTHPANVAVILTRYGSSNETIVAGILHDVIEDCVTEGYTREMLEQRIGDKFGAKVLETVLSVTYRRHDDDGTIRPSTPKRQWKSDMGLRSDRSRRPPFECGRLRDSDGLSTRQSRP